MTSKSSILYQNAEATVFLIDIPTSIALAQELSPQQQPDPSHSKHSNPTVQNRKRHIRSSSPLKTPYPPSSEPRTDAARAKLLAQIPSTERLVHEAIEPVVVNALSVLHTQYGQESNWCLKRCSLCKEANNEHHDNEHGHFSKMSWKRAGKRRRSDQKSKTQEHECLLQPSSEARILDTSSEISQPPLILSPNSNRFESGAVLCNTIVRNTSTETAMVTVRCSCSTTDLHADTVNGYPTPQRQDHTFIVPPISSFVIGDIPISPPTKRLAHTHPIPGLPLEQRFNLILLDPPWPNRSVRRSRHYKTHTYLDSKLLERKIRDILKFHSFPTPDKSPTTVAAIWVTNSAKAREITYNSLTRTGFSVFEEWVWVKTTVDGQPISPVGGLWRKPYEVLVIGRKRHVSTPSDEADTVLRRVIAAVPDVHSRKPNLRELFEMIILEDQDSFGLQYSALEVFARNLTAGWWACGNEVLKFNSKDWWIVE